jgi:signal recognition particle receptor subunit beta
MAALDNDHLVVRVVYTGPPLAGKTQSVRALMPLLRGKGAEQAVVSPGEWRGRTAFFDWADFEGGTYEGKPIRCQILSTPGQVSLSDRRELLLRSADAVIIVVDSQEEGLERATQCYEEMAPWLAEAGHDVPIRVILQCNKQDLPHAISPEAISRMLRLPCGKDVFATSATTGEGLREVFVAGVRNAVARVSALLASGVVLEPPSVSSGHDLFERMQREVAPLRSHPPEEAMSSPSKPSPSKSSAPKGASPKAGQPGTSAARSPSTSTGGRPSNPATGVANAASPSARPATKPSRSGSFPVSGGPVRRPAPARETTPGAAAPRTSAALHARRAVLPRPAPLPPGAYFPGFGPASSSGATDRASGAAPAVAATSGGNPGPREATPEPLEKSVSVLPPARQVVDPSLFGLETSAFVDEPSESFRIPETPRGLQALLEPWAGPARSRAQPGAEAAGAEHDVVRGSSRAAAGSEEPNEAPQRSVAGPSLPGRTRLPRAVWRRACWRALENQLSVHASALQDARGRWLGELAPGWFARTLRNVPGERAARHAFAQQVLRERQLAAYLSRPRCSVLTEEADGFWVWQVACRVPTLATILRPRLAADEPPGSMSDALLDAALGYLDAHQRFVQARVPLPLSPHALSFQDGRVVYSGLMPDAGAVFAEPAGNGYAAFQDALHKMWPDPKVDASPVLAELRSKAAGRLPEPLLEVIREVMGQR